MDTIYTARQFFAAVIIAVFLAGGAGYYLGRSSMQTSGENTLKNSLLEANLDLGGSMTLNSKNAVVVNDQAAGNEVLISQVSLEQSAWVAVHEDRGGTPGNILGARRYQAGITQAATTIELLRPTVRGIYYAMLHGDSGDAEFDHQRDLPLMAAGHPVMMRFMVGGSEEL